MTTIPNETGGGGESFEQWLADRIADEYRRRFDAETDKLLGFSGGQAVTTVPTETAVRLLAAERARGRREGTLETALRLVALVRSCADGESVKIAHDWVARELKSARERETKETT